MCEHSYCSGTLTLEPPARLIVIAWLACDMCGQRLHELPWQSAEATVTALLALPRLAVPEPT
jgi:hypothetical protein